MPHGFATPNTIVQSVLSSYPEILYRSFGPPITSVFHESRWQSIDAKDTSLVFCLLASVEGTMVCLRIPLQCPPPPPGGRPSRAREADFKGGGGNHAGIHHSADCDTHAVQISTGGAPTTRVWIPSVRFGWSRFGAVTAPPPSRQPPQNVRPCPQPPTPGGTLTT